MSVYQQAVIPLSSGVLEYVVTFSTPFSTEPTYISTTVYDSAEGAIQEWIGTQVVEKNTNSFTVRLINSPPNNNYVLSYLAGSTSFETLPSTLPSFPINRVPLYPSDTISDDATFIIVTPLPSSKTYRLTWNQFKSFVGNTHHHSLNDIEDMSSLARQINRATTDTEILDLISAANVVHTHVVDDLTDASAVGKAVLVATDQAAARAALNAANVVHTHISTDITDASALGLLVLTAPDQTTALTDLGASPVHHTHPISDIAFGTTGALLAATTTPSNARTVISALPQQGWSTSINSISGSVNLTDSYGGVKSELTAPTTITLNPANYSSTGQLVAAFYSTTSPLTLATGGGSTIFTSSGTALSSPSTLGTGLHILEQFSANKWIVSTYKGTFGSTLLESASNTAAKTSLALTANDITDAGTAGKVILQSAAKADIISYLGVQSNQTSIVQVSGISSTVALSTLYTGNPAEYVFIAGRSGDQTINLDTLGTMLPGQKFHIAAYSGNVTIVESGSVLVNDGSSYNGPYVITQGGVVTLWKEKDISTVSYLIGDFPGSSAHSRLAYVSSSLGSDASGAVGNSTKPYQTIKAACIAISNGDLVYVTPGTYNENGNLAPSNKTVRIYATNGVSITNTSTTSALFDSVAAGGAIAVTMTGEADITVTNTSTTYNLINITTATSFVDITCNSINANNTNNKAICIINGVGHYVRLTTNKDVYMDSGSNNFFNITSAQNVSLNVKGTLTLKSPLALFTTAGTLRVNVYENLLTPSLYPIVSGSSPHTVFINCHGSPIQAYGSSGGFNINNVNTTLVIQNGDIAPQESTIAIRHNVGQVKFISCILRGTVYLNGNTLILSNCQQIANNTDNAITVVAGTQTLYIVGILTTDSEPDGNNVDFIGGNIVINSTLNF